MYTKWKQFIEDNIRARYKDLAGNKIKIFKYSETIVKLLNNLSESIFQDISLNHADKFQVSQSEMEKHIDAIWTRNFIKIMVEYDQQTFKSKDTPVHQKITWYAQMIRPKFVPGGALNEDQKQVIGFFLLAALVCPILSTIEDVQVQSFEKPYYQKVAQELIPLCEEQWQNLNAPEAIMQAELRVLRTTNMQDFKSDLLVKYHNYIVNLEAAKQKKIDLAQGYEHDYYFQSPGYERDKHNLSILKSLADKMIDQYSKSDGSNLDHFDEIVELSPIKDPELFRKILNTLYTEINKFLFVLDPVPHKLMCLAMVLVNGGMNVDKDKLDEVTFIVPADMNACANMVRIKLDQVRDKGFADTRNNDQDKMIHSILDSLILILRILEKLMLKGFSPKQSKAIKKTLKDFISAFEGRAIGAASRAIKKSNKQAKGLLVMIAEASSLDMQQDFTNKMGFQLQARVAMQAVNRIDQRFKSDFAKGFDLAIESLGGLGPLVSGIASGDFEKISAGATDLAQTALMQYDKSPKDWYDNINFMLKLADTDFDAFANQFFDGDMTRSNNVQTLKADGESRLIITYFTIRCLDEIIRNRTKSHNVRMQAVTLMRYVYENKNYENKKQLVYNCNYNMKFFIKERLANAIRMKNDECHRCDQDDMDALCKYAHLVLLSMHINSEEATQYVNKLVQEYSHNMLGENNRFEYSDFYSASSNDFLVKTLRERLPYEYQLSLMYRNSVETYNKEIKYLTRVMLNGIKYMDGNEDLHYIDPQNNQENIELPRKKSSFSHKCLLQEAVPEFLASHQKVMLVQGQTGSGKSQFMKILENKMWTNYKHGHNNYVPILIKLGNVKTPSRCIQEYLANFDSKKFQQYLLKEGSNKLEHVHFLILFDGFDELISPKNLLEINKLQEWDDDTKVLITAGGKSPTNTDYLQYFKFKDDNTPVLEYRIADIDDGQLHRYIKKVVKKNIAIIEEDLNEDQTKMLKNYQDIDSYLRYINEIQGLRELMVTPYMMSIVISCLPQLSVKNSHEKDKRGKSDSGKRKSNIGNWRIYKCFTNLHFEEKMNELMEDDAVVLPKGYDCMKSFKNYSLALAIEMWVDKLSSVKSRAANFAYPRGQEKLLQKMENEELQFLKFFTSDERTAIARMGAQIIEDEGHARFTHISIQQYFAAEVLFNYINEYNPNDMKHVPIEKSYLNAALLSSKNGSMDYSSEVLEFFTGNLLRKREKFTRSLIQSYEKAGKNPDNITDEEKLSQAEKNIIQILAGINKDNLKSKYMQNVMLIASKFVMIMKRVPDAIMSMLLGDEDTIDLLKVGLLWGKALQALEKNDNEMCLMYQLQAVGKQLKGAYHGDVVVEGSDSKKVIVQAHGQGKIKYENLCNYEGGFQNNMKHGEGEYVFSLDSQQNEKLNKATVRPNNKLVTFDRALIKKKYIGSFVDDLMQGEGKLEYGNNSSYKGSFLKGKRSGKGSITYSFAKMEYHGSWLNDKWHGEGVVISSDPQNKFVCEGLFFENALHGDVTITFGSSDYNNMVFKGLFDEGVCKSGFMQVSADGQSLQGIIKKKDNFVFKFYHQDELHDEYDNIIVYYENSNQEIIRKTFDNFVKGERFFNHAEKKQADNALVLGKIFIVGRKRLLALGKQESIDKCSEKAKEDGVIRLYDVQLDTKIQDLNTKLVSAYSEDLLSQKMEEVTQKYAIE